MAWKKGKQYALVLADYVARFEEVPPSILTEESATEVMLAALECNEGEAGSGCDDHQGRGWRRTRGAS